MNRSASQEWARQFTIAAAGIWDCNARQNSWLLMITGLGSCHLLDGQGVRTEFEWTAETLFYVPADTEIRLFNGQGHLSANFVQLMATSKYAVMAAPDTADQAFTLQTNRIRNVLEFPLISDPCAGLGAGRLEISAPCGMRCRLAQFGSKMSQRATDGQPIALVMLSGCGIAASTCETVPAEYQRWDIGTLFVLHRGTSLDLYNESSLPARYLAFASGGRPIAAPTPSSAFTTFMSTLQ